ncbi:MAG: 50S ribosomal protein L25/general stress protein Ctc [Pseudomonadota bacterium]
MSDDLDLVAEIREDRGKGASRRLRRQGKVPAILYGGGRPPRALMLDHNKLIRQMQEESFYSSVLTIQAGDRAQPAIVKDVQRHPSKPQVLHLDLQRVLADEKIRMNVPLHFLGEEIAVGVKQHGGVVSRLMNEVEVSCLPADLPEYIEIDISGLDMDEMLHLSNLEVPAGVELIELSYGEDHDQPIVSIHKPKQVIEVSEEETAEEADAEAGAEGDDAAPAEDDEKGDED